MSILEYILISIVILLAAYLVLQRFVVRKIADDIVAQDRSAKLNYNDLAVSYLSLLTRELANELIQRDTEFFRRNFLLLTDEWRRIKETKGLSEKTLEQLSIKYPTYRSFAPYDVHDYVLVGEAAETLSNEELWECYRDAKLYAAILCDDGIGSPDRCHEYLKSLQETQLLNALHEAEDGYWALRVNDIDLYETGEVDTPKYKFTWLPDTMEKRVGVHLKEIDEYGIIGWFYDDKSYVSYYKSAASYDLEERFNDYKFKSFLSSRRDLSSIKKLQ